jgi:hypothetical protein
MAVGNIPWTATTSEPEPCYVAFTLDCQGIAKDGKEKTEKRNDAFCKVLSAI